MIRVSPLFMWPMRLVLVLVLLLVAGYLAGPRTRRPRLDPALPPAPAGPAAAEAYLNAKESHFHLRPDNQARVVWAGRSGQATPWCIVYLHGYSACWREGGPVHQNTAKRYGANLLLTRLQAHGLVTDEPLLDMDADALWQDAKEALVLGHALGRKVLIMATSSGAPLALHLAAEYPDQVDGLVLYSPNLRIKHPFAWVMDLPWGVQIARLVKHGKYNEITGSDEVFKYWYRRQRLEGAAQLQALLDTADDPKVFARVHAPVYVACYYRDEAHQDPTIDVAAARKLMPELGTLPAQRRYTDFPLARAHVIACDLTCPDWKGVQQGTWDFLEQVMGWKPK